MRSKILVLVTVVLSLLLAIGISTFAVSAEEAEPSVTIAKFNLAFEDNTYLKYAVRFDGVDDEKITENNIGMLYWTDYEGGFVPGTENFSSKTTGYTDISGVKHYVFEYTRIAAMNLTDYIYSVAYIELDGTTYYSAPVKYSALEYAYNRLGKTNAGTTNAELKALLNNMLAYGASAQQYFNYKEDRLATADFYQLTLVGGTLADGFTSGLYLSTDEVTITAPEIDGKTFAGWQNENGETIYTENPATVENLTANTTLTATYEDAVKYSQGLAFTSNGNGTCYVSGIGTCTDTDIVIPPVSPDGDRVTSIGDEAFSYLLSLNSIIISDNITKIGKKAFYRCSNLRKLTIGENVVSINNYAFYDCIYLEQIVFNATSMYNLYTDTNFGNGVFYNAGKESEGIAVIIGKNVKSIPAHLFHPSELGGYPNLANIYFENDSTCQKIGDYAFYNCKQVTDLYFPNSLTEIGSYNFYGCTNLKKLRIGNDISKIGYNAFGLSYSFSCYEYENAYYIGNEENPYLILVKAISTEISSCVIHQDARIIMPNAFSYCEKMNDILLPQNIVCIGDYAFSDCTSLKSINVHSGIMHIGRYAFSNCRYLKTINIPETIQTIEAGTFYNCESLGKIDIHKRITHIKKDAFHGCIQLKGVYIQDIASWCNITFENTYSNPLIHARSLYINKNLVNGLIIPNSITSVNEYAFYYCTTPTSIVISNSVTNIGASAFPYCPNLTDVYYTGTEEEWSAISIGSNNTPLTNATRYYYSETRPTTDGNFWHYDENSEIAIWPEYVAADEPFEECNGFHYLGDVKVPKGLTEVYSKSEHPDIRVFADAPLSSEPTHAYYLCSKCGAVEDIMAIE